MKAFAMQVAVVVVGIWAASLIPNPVSFFKKA